MAKIVCVQVIGHDKPLRITADKIVKEDAKLVLKTGDQQIGEFRIDQVAGWWIEE